MSTESTVVDGSASPIETAVVRGGLRSGRENFIICLKDSGNYFRILLYSPPVNTSKDNFLPLNATWYPDRPCYITREEPSLQNKIPFFPTLKVTYISLTTIFLSFKCRSTLSRNWQAGWTESLLADFKTSGDPRHQKSFDQSFNLLYSMSPFYPFYTPGSGLG